MSATDPQWSAKPDPTAELLAQSLASHEWMGLTPNQQQPIKKSIEETTWELMSTGSANVALDPAQPHENHLHVSFYRDPEKPRTIGEMMDRAKGQLEELHGRLGTSPASSDSRLSSPLSASMPRVLIEMAQPSPFQFLTMFPTSRGGRRYLHLRPSSPGANYTAEMFRELRSSAPSVQKIAELYGLNVIKQRQIKSN